MKNIKIGSLCKTNIKGTVEYGIVDHTVNGVASFLYSHENMWAGKLVDVDEIHELEQDELKMAATSAMRYWVFEIKSLENRIKMQYAEDDQTQLKSLLADAKEWVKKLISGK